MKKFTKITLMIAAILVALGIICCGIAAIMGAGWTTIHQKALAGEFDFGNWHIGNGVYYAYDQGHGILDHFWDDDYDDDDDWDDDWDNDDWDDEDDELVDDNRAVESFGSWILNLTGLKSEPAGTESCIIPYPASEAASSGGFSCLYSACRRSGHNASAGSFRAAGTGSRSKWNFLFPMAADLSNWYRPHHL